MDIGDISPDMCTHIIVSKYSIYFDNVLGMASADSVKDMSKMIFVDQLLICGINTWTHKFTNFEPFVP